MFIHPDTEKVSAIRDRFGLNGSKVIGFFGTFFEWEGVDSLIKVLPAVLESVPDAKLFIAGGGNQEKLLHDLVAKLGLEERTVFAGRVAHDEIPACYAAVDVMAYPRVPDRLTNMVTPLKPLESMAQGTVVVASDVGGHQELIEDGQTGELFRAGDLDDLARKLVNVLRNPDKVRDMTEHAMKYVQRERRWSSVVDGYIPVYEQLSQGNRG
jgi:glycosyltransferase involved in cell wall biosynthesis